MPSTVGHSLMSYIIYRATARPVGTPSGWLISLYVFAANAPDLDFVPGLLVGDLSRFHHGPSHSVGFAVFFGIVSSLFFTRRRYAFLIASSLYLSHVILDFLVQDPSPPHGVPLFWPFSNEYYMAPFAFFPRFDYMSSSEKPLLSPIFSFHNLLTVLIEAALLVPVLMLVLSVRRRFITPSRTDMNSTVA
jgi:inner membrane protein